MQQEVEPFRKAYEEQIELLSEEHNQATIEFFKNIYQVFACFEEWLDEDLAHIQRMFPRRPAWQRLLFASMSDAARRQGRIVDRGQESRTGGLGVKICGDRRRRRADGPLQYRRGARPPLDVYANVSRLGRISIASDQKSLGQVLRYCEEADVAHKQAMRSVVRVLRQCEAQAQSELNSLLDTRLRGLLAQVRWVEGDMRALMRRAGRDGVSLSLPVDLVAQRVEQLRAYIREQTSGAVKRERLMALSV